MKYSESLHNQILQHKIDLSSLDLRELAEWLKSSFILIFPGICFALFFVLIEQEEVA